MPEELGPRPEQLYSEHTQHTDELRGIQEVQQKESEVLDFLHSTARGLDAVVKNLQERPPKGDAEEITKSVADLMTARETIANVYEDMTAESILNRGEDTLLREEAQDKIDANLWKAQQHLRANEAAYKQKAVNEAQAAGKDVKYGPYTNADPVYDYSKYRKLVFDANSDPKPVTVEEFAIQNKQIQAERDAALADPTLNDDEKFAKFVDAHRKSTELERRSPFRNDPDTQASRYNRKFALEVSTETDIDKLNQDLQSAERDISRLNDQLRRAEDLDDQENIRRCEAELQKLLGDASIIRWRIVRLREQDEDALSAPPPPPSANLPTEEPEWDRPVFED